MPDWCLSGHVDLGIACRPMPLVVSNQWELRCDRSCGVLGVVDDGSSDPPQSASAGYSDSRQSVVTCSDDFTGHASDRRVVFSVLEWTPSASRLMAVDLWGGGGGGTGSVIRTQQTDDIGDVAAFGFSAISNVVCHNDVDMAGNVRYVSAGDMYHLGRKEDCIQLQASRSCWTIKPNPAFFESNELDRNLLSIAQLGWPHASVPLGSHTWTFYQISNSRHVPYAARSPRHVTVELKPLVTSYGVCGGSGGGGAQVRAVVEVKAGHTDRIEAGRGRRGASGRRGAQSGQSSRLLEKSDRGTWHVLAEAGGGFGAGLFDENLEFSPGGQGGVAPDLKAHSSAAPGQQGQPSRANFQFSDTVLPPDALRTLPERLFNLSTSLTCSVPIRHEINHNYGFVPLADPDWYVSDPPPSRYGLLPPVCKAQDVRRPAFQKVNWDYFVSCDVRCIGTEWPSSPAGGQLIGG